MMIFYIVIAILALASWVFSMLAAFLVGAWFTNHSHMKAHESLVNTFFEGIKQVMGKND